MTEPVVIGNATLYLGDCREILSTETFRFQNDNKKRLPSYADVVITDPVWPNCPKGLIPGSDDPVSLWREVQALLVCHRLVVVMRHDSDPAMLTNATAGLPFFRLQILPYVMPGYIGRKLGGDEIAYCYGEPIPSAPGQRVIPGYAPKVQPDGRKANGHPCSRSLKHFEWLASWWSSPHESILDPFMGSGTTGVACMNLGRKFIGIELDPEYFDIACERIDNAQRQMRMFA